MNPVRVQKLSPICWLRWASYSQSQLSIINRWLSSLPEVSTETMNLESCNSEQFASQYSTYTWITCTFIQSLLNHPNISNFQLFIPNFNWLRSAIFHSFKYVWTFYYTFRAHICLDNRDFPQFLSYERQFSNVLFWFEHDVVERVANIARS